MGVEDAGGQNVNLAPPWWWKPVASGIPDFGTYAYSGLSSEQQAKLPDVGGLHSRELRNMGWQIVRAVELAQNKTG